MFNPFERLLAFRYLRARKAEGFVSVIATFSFLGILLGVATLIIVMSVMNGFRAELFDRILGLNGHINVYVPGQPLEDYKDLVKKIEKTEGVSFAFPTIEGQALVNANGTASGVVVRGIRAEDMALKPVLKDSFKMGNPALLVGNRVAIGNKMAERLRLQIGDKLLLTAPKGKQTPFGNIPRSAQFEVAGVFDVGMHEYNNNFIFMPLPAAQGFFDFDTSDVSMLEIFLANLNDLEKAKLAVYKAMDGMANVYDWRDANSSFVNALEVERNVMFLILTLIIIVAAFNIISSMIMLVKDKGPDIAIMRTMGASSGSMLKIFILTGASIGIAGTVIGAGLGIAFALNIEAIRGVLQTLTGTELFSSEIYFLTQLPAKIDWHEVAAIICTSIIISVLATIYPAWRAAKLDPVEGLRYG
ncbi:MAG: lipoprotein-releasing ABC transporter permease subunit [Alphaproteobacteria bacterium]|nr:lipoprotein-releasing ABC transporter permease subunit [Alphaproteobacteria bacterium]